MPEPCGRGRARRGGGGPDVRTGQAAEVAYEDGESDTVMLFPKRPSMVFRATVKNAGAAPRVMERVRPAWFAASGARMNVLGTGRLHPAEKAPGSYM
jgi:hypothetical protein